MLVGSMYLDYSVLHLSYYIVFLHRVSMHAAAVDQSKYVCDKISGFTAESILAATARPVKLELKPSSCSYHISG